MINPYGIIVIYARPLIVFLALSLAPACADLSWEYTDKRKAQAEEAREHQKTIEEIQKREQQRQPSAEEKAAYSKLGKALAEHPAMAEVNLTEAKAIAEFEKAQQGGNELEVSLASQKLAEAKANRFQKAASIPELRQLIQAWQQTALTPSTPKEEAEAKKNTEAISQKLGNLLKQIGK